MIVTIDGPAGTGKSTVAKQLAQHLGWHYHNTGAIYRALTGGLIDKGWINKESQCLSPEHEKELEKLSIRVIPGAIAQYLLDDQDVSAWVKDPSIALLVSRVSSWRPIRQKLLSIQRELAQLGPAVFEGRDMGTTVFPNADLKFFLTASSKERAKRRLLELQSSGKSASFEEVLADIEQRDEQDFSREISPLRKPEDALVIDTSEMSIEQVEMMLYKICRESFSLENELKSKH